MFQANLFYYFSIFDCNFNRRTNNIYNSDPEVLDVDSLD